MTAFAESQADEGIGGAFVEDVEGRVVSRDRLGGDGTRKQKLQSGQAVAGTCLYLNNPDTLKAIADVGFDFLLIDTQHSGIGPDTLSTMLSAISHTESEIIVRVIWNNNYLINQALDWGADGIVVPLINTAADAERAIQGAKYPPQGARSWGPNPRG